MLRVCCLALEPGKKFGAMYPHGWLAQRSHPFLSAHTQTRLVGYRCIVTLHKATPPISADPPLHARHTGTAWPAQTFTRPQRYPQRSASKVSHQKSVEHEHACTRMGPGPIAGSSQLNFSLPWAGQSFENVPSASQHAFPAPADA